MKVIIKENFYVITGGPGVGKTTLIKELFLRGYKFVPEVAREIIRTEISNNGDALPWKDAKKYSGLILENSVRDFLKYMNVSDACFFDRGIPDTYGYEILMNFEIDMNLLEAVRKYRYNTKVFILPPWEEIYATDNERRQDFETAVKTYRVLWQAYEKSGYELIEVPTLPIEKRADYLLNMIDLYCGQL